MAAVGLTALLFAAGLTGQAEPIQALSPARASGASASRAFSAPRPGAAMRVVVTFVEVAPRGGSPALGREGLQAALERGLAAGGLDVIPHRQVSAALERHHELRACRHSTCRAGLGRLVGASLCTEVGLRGGGGELEVTVSIFDCATGALRVTRKRACRAGTSEQAAEAVARLAEEASEWAERAMSVAAARGGAKAASAGARARRSYPGRSALFWSGISLSGAGLLAVVAGGTIWSLDGQTQQSTPSMDRLYRTRTGGITTTSLGIAAVLGGVAMALVAILGSPTEPEGSGRSVARPVLSVTLDPARRWVGLVGSF